MTKLFILSPLSQFEVVNLIGVNAPILGHLHINLTNLALYAIFTIAIILGLHIYGNNMAKVGENYIPYGVGATIASATLKHTTGGSLGARIVGATAAGGLSVLTTGIAGSAVKGLNNAREESELKRRFERQRLERLEELNKTDSSDNHGGESTFTANSPLDSGEMNNPLLDILDNIILYHIIELLFIFVIINFILNIIVKNKIGLFLKKYIPSNYIKIHNFINKVINTSGKIDFIFVLGLLIFYLFIKLIGIYIIIKFKINIDDLIYLYNDIKKSSLIFSCGFYTTNRGVKYNIHKRYKHIINKQNINKISKYLCKTNPALQEGGKKEELIEHSAQINQLLNKININNNFMPDYKLVRSFENVNLINEEGNLNEKLQVDEGLRLDEEYGISNMKEYIFGFKELLEGLEDGKIYKIIFRWKSVDSNYLGEKSVEYNTSPSFFIYKNIDIDVLLYKFMSYLNIFDNKYGFGGFISLDVFVKQWIDENDFKTFNLILNKLKDEYQKGKEIQKLSKLRILDKSSNESLSFFKSDIGRLDKTTLAVLIKGLEYGTLVSHKEMDDFNYTQILNINKETDSLYRFKSNVTLGMRKKSFLVKVTRTEDKLEELEVSGIYKVSVFIDTTLGFTKQNLVNYSEIESWEDTIKKSGNTEIVERITQNNGLNITFENNKIIKLDKKINSKKLLEAFQDFDQDIDIGVLDIETFNNEKNEAIPYAIGFKKKSGTQMFYLDSYNNSSEMILDCLDKLLVKENHNFKFYAHNMSQFDGIILLKSLMDMSNNHDFIYNVQSNNEGKIISLDIVKKKSRSEENY